MHVECLFLTVNGMQRVSVDNVLLLVMNRTVY